MNPSIENVELEPATPIAIPSANLAPGGKVTTRVIRTVSEIEDIRPSWESWQYHPNADIDFYLWFSRQGREILRPHVIVVYRGGYPDAMLIGRVIDGTMALGLGYKKLWKPRVRLLNFVYGALLGNACSENTEAMVSSVRDALREYEADAAVFNFVGLDSALYSHVLRSPGWAARDYCPTVQTHWSMKLPGTVEEVYRGLSGDHRSEIRRKAKKLTGDYAGNIRVRCLRETADLDLLFRDVEEVARKTYQRGLGVGFVDTTEMRQRLQLEAEKGWLRTYILYAANLPCAFWMGTVYRGKFYSDCLGYDPSYEKYSPGTFLLNAMIEDSCRDGIEQVDFGLGDARYKQRFGNCSWQEVTAYIYGPSWRGLRVNALRTPAAFLDRLTKQALDRTNLLPKIKKLWRNRLRQL